jgi:cell division protein FtsB
METHPAIRSLRETITQTQAELDELSARRKAKRAELKKYVKALRVEGPTHRARIAAKAVATASAPCTI